MKPDMHDEDLERLLERYEPAGPSSSLRARVIGARPAPGAVAALSATRVWPWAAVAAALVALTVWLHAASAGVAGQHADAALDVSEEDALASIMGDTDEARRIARRIATIDADAQTSARPVATTGAGGGQ